MPTTPNGFRYPDDSYPVAVPLDVQKLALDVDSQVVKASGGTFSGGVTFNTPPSVPLPTINAHAANKEYVDAVAADVTAIETELGTNPSGTFSTVVERLDTYTDGFDDVGNLLTANQASGTETLTNTTGFGVFGGHAIAASTWGPGVAPAALLCTFSGTGAGGPIVGAPGGGATAPATIPVTGGAVHTFQVSLRADENAPFTIAIYWYQSNGTTAASTASVESGQFTSPTTAATFRLTATAPANAAKASVYIRRASGANGIVWAFNQFSFHRGAGGQWAMPGVPIPGQGAIKANGAVELPGGDSAPNGGVTAPPGSTFLQTSGAATKTGMLSWRKETGTGNTGWVAEGALADTGWRNVTSANAAKFQTWGALRIRRVGSQVFFLVRATVGSGTASGTSSPFALLTLPSGFQPTEYVTWGRVTVAALSGAPAKIADLNTAGSRGSLDLSSPSSGNWTDSVSGAATWNTDDAWPTSLPGTAA